MCNSVPAITAIIITVITVINQCNIDYIMESSLHARSEIMYKGLDHKDSGGKKEDAREIQTVFCWKMWAPQVSSLDVWGIFTYFCSTI